MGIQVALILMVGALGVGVLALLFAIALDVHRGVGLWAKILSALEGPESVLPTPKPFDRSAAIASGTRIYEAAQRARLAEEGDGQGTHGRRGGAAPVQLDLEPPLWRACSPDGSKIGDDEPTLVSPVSVSPMAASVEVLPYRAVPEVAPLGEDEAPLPHERQSGTWTRGGGR